MRADLASDISRRLSVKRPNTSKEKSGGPSPGLPSVILKTF